MMLIKRISLLLLCTLLIIGIVVYSSINTRIILGVLLFLLLITGLFIISILDNKKHKQQLQIIHDQLITSKASFARELALKDSKIMEINEEFLQNQKESETLKILYKKHINIIRKKEKIIPVLIEQLKAVIEYTDKSAADLISGFLNINKKTKQHTHEVKNIFNNNDISDDEQSVLLENKKIYKILLGNMEKSLEISKDITFKMHESINEYSSIQSIIATIQNLVDQIKVISLNALIESTRVHTGGNGFSVVAREMQRLSEQSSHSANEIEEKVHQLIKKSTTVFSQTENEINGILSILKDSEATMVSSIQNIDDYLTFLKDKLIFISQYTQNLAKEISRIVVSIQFQDITRQRIEHIIQPLEFLLVEELEIKCFMESSMESDNSTDSTAIQNWLSQFYTMEDEKDILKAMLKQLN